MLTSQSPHLSQTWSNKIVFVACNDVWIYPRCNFLCLKKQVLKVGWAILEKVIDCWDDLLTIFPQNCSPHHLTTKTLAVVKALKLKQTKRSLNSCWKDGLTLDHLDFHRQTLNISLHFHLFWLVYTEAAIDAKFTVFI